MATEGDTPSFSAATGFKIFDGLDRAVGVTNYTGQSWRVLYVNATITPESAVQQYQIDLGLKIYATDVPVLAGLTLNCDHDPGVCDQFGDSCWKKLLCERPDSPLPEAKVVRLYP